MTEPTRSEVDDFIRANDIDERAAADLRNCAGDIQRKVLARGELSTARNPSAALLARIRDARSSPSASGGGGTGSQEVEDFIKANDVDESAADMLRSSSPTVQRTVLSRGELKTARNPSSALLSRIRDAKLGLPPPGPPGGNSYGGGGGSYDSNIGSDGGGMAPQPSNALVPCSMPPGGMPPGGYGAYGYGMFNGAYAAYGAYGGYPGGPQPDSRGYGGGMPPGAGYGGYPGYGAPGGGTGLSPAGPAGAPPGGPYGGAYGAYGAYAGYGMSPNGMMSYGQHQNAYGAPPTQGPAPSTQQALEGQPKGRRSRSRSRSSSSSYSRSPSRSRRRRRTRK